MYRLFCSISALYYVRFFYDNYSASTFVAIETSTSSKWLMHHGKSTRPQSPVQFKVGRFYQLHSLLPLFSAKMYLWHGSLIFALVSMYGMKLPILNISGITPILYYWLFSMPRYIHLIGFYEAKHVTFQLLPVQPWCFKVLSPGIRWEKMQLSDVANPSFHNNPNFCIIFLNNGILC